jgi:uncharacterized membrane protein
MAIEGERSIAALLKDIVGNLEQIVRAEIRLAKAEVRQEVDRARRGATLLIGGVAVAVLALPFLLLAGVYGLATVVAPWIAALIVAAVAGAIGGAFIVAGIKQMRQVTIMPPKAVAAIEDSIQWAKIRTR